MPTTEKRPMPAMVLLRVKCLASTIAGNNFSLYHNEQGQLPADEALRHAKARNVDILEEVSAEWRQWALEELDYSVPARRGRPRKQEGDE